MLRVRVEGREFRVESETEFMCTHEITRISHDNVK